MTEKISFGIEIECILNSEIHKIYAGSYHSGTSVKNFLGWKAERDGSIHGRNEFTFSQNIEFISSILVGKTKFKNALKKFEKKFSMNGKYELNKVLVFNSSCGSHVHISMPNFTFGKKVTFKIYPLVRKYFLNLIKKSNINSKEAIISHYNRNYSKLLTRHNGGHRTVEFNLQSERAGQGLEWRSLNMLNIKTWKEFQEFWDIVLKTIEFLIKKSQNYSVIEETDFATPKKLKEMEQDSKEFEDETIKLEGDKVI